MKTDILERVPMSLCSIKSFCFVSIFLALLLSEMISIIHIEEKEENSAEKEITVFRPQKLYPKRVSKYLLTKLSSATKFVVASKV